MQKKLFILVSCSLLLVSAQVSAQIINTICGTGTATYSGDGGPATAAGINAAQGIATDAAGNIYIADANNNRIRKITTAGTISTIAGTGTAAYSGDGGQATAAALNNPVAITMGPGGNLYIADEYNQRIRKINASGIISTVAGNGTAAYSGDGNTATNAELNYPTGIAIDASGNVYIADDLNNRIRKVATNGIISTFAGTGTSGYVGDGGTPTAAELYFPLGVAIDGGGNIYIADEYNHRIRKVNASGVINTIAGNGTGGFSGDGGAATAAELNHPMQICFDAGGNIYIADNFNNRIRKLTTSGIISTFAGNGTSGFAGDGSAATAADLNSPQGIVAAAGSIFLCDVTNNRIRKVTSIIPYNVSVSPSTICAGDSVTVTLSNSQPYPVVYGLAASTHTNSIVGSPQYSATGGGALHFPTGPLSSTTTFAVVGVTVGSTDTTLMNNFVTVIVHPLPILNISPGNDTICMGQTDTLMALGSPSSYIWSVGTSSTANNPLIVTPTVTTTYSVTATDDSTGCINKASLTIQVLNCGCPATVVISAKDSATSNSIANGSSIPCNNGGPFYITAFQPSTTTPDSINDIYTPCIALLVNNLQPGLRNNGTITPYEGIVNLGCIGPAAACGARQIGYPSYNYGTAWEDYVTYLDFTKPHSFVFSTTNTIPTTTVTLKSCWSNQVFSTYIWSAAGVSTHTINIPASTNIGKSTFSISPPPTLPNAFIDLHNGNCIIHPRIFDTVAYTVTYHFSDTLCMGDSTTFTFNILPPNINWTPPLLCINGSCDTLTHQLNSLAPTNGTWSGPVGMITPTGIFCPPHTVGNYNVTYTVGTGACSAAQSHTITVNGLPTIRVNSDTICLGDTAILLAQGAVTYTWMPSVNLNTSLDSFVIASPNVTTIYTVTGTDAASCKNITTATITIASDTGILCSKTTNSTNGPIQIHNAFSPNGDGLNDLFIIDNIGEFTDNHVYIYNRWGQLLWDKQGYNNTTVVWTGKSSNGAALYAGTYFYIIEKAGPKSLKGWVEITSVNK